VYTLMHEIELKPSRRLGLLLAAMAALALLAVGLAAMPVAAKLGAAIAVISLVVWGWRGRSRTGRLRLVPDGGLQGCVAAGEWHDVEVLDDSFVSPVLVVLRLRMEGEPPRSLALLSDCAAADDLRRLRVWLRWARRTHSDTSSPGAG
jgi:toxin CptA